MFVVAVDRLWHNRKERNINLEEFFNRPTLRFLTHYLHVTKCLPDPKHKQSPGQTVLNDVPRHKGTPYDTFLTLLQSLNLIMHAAALGMYANLSWREATTLLNAIWRCYLLSSCFVLWRDYSIVHKARLAIPKSSHSQVGRIFNGPFYYSIDHWYLVCFMSRLFSDFTTPSVSLFFCPLLTEPPGGVCASRKSTCFGDESCSSIAKCCFDGCRFSCVGRDGKWTGDFQHPKRSIKTTLLALPTW